MQPGPWRERIAALVGALQASPRVEIRALHLFPPAASARVDLPPGLAGLYAETDGVQLAWVDRQSPAYDPTAEAWLDAPAPWDADPSGWTGAIWILPADAVTSVVDPLAGGIRVDGDELVLPDGTRGPADAVLVHLLNTLGCLGRRDGPLLRAPLAIGDLLVDEPDVERGTSLAVSVVDVRRTSPEDAAWAWADRGLDTDQVSARWARPDGSAPAEVVEVELEAASLPPALLPHACSEALVRQLLGPWGNPAGFVAAVDLTERPRWIVAFAADPSSDDELEPDTTADTEVRPIDAPFERHSPLAGSPVDEDPTHDGLQLAIAVRFPTGAPDEGGDRVFPSPVALARRWSAPAFPGGRIYALAAAPDSKRLAAIAESGELRLWRAEGAPIPVEVQAEPESFSECGFGRDGRLAVWDGNLVARWDADGRAAGFVHQRMAGIEGFECDDNEFALWANRPVFLDLRGDVHGTIDALDDDLVSRSALSASGRHLVVGTEGGQVAWYGLEPLVQRWRMSTDLGEIRAIALMPRGWRVAVGGREAVALFDADGGELRRMPAHDGEVVALAWVAEGRYLASIGTDRALRLWDGRCGALVHERFLPQVPTALAAAPNGKWLAIALPNRLDVLDVQLNFAKPKA